RKMIEQWEKDSEKGKKPTKPRKSRSVDELTKDELSNLHELPENWWWGKINDITLRAEYGTSNKSLDEGEIPVLRMGNMQNGKIDWSDLKYSNDPKDNEEYLLKEEDVLFNRTNSPELVGKAVIYKGEQPAIFAGYLIRLNQVREVMNGYYLNYFLNSVTAKNHGNTVKTDGVNQSNINGTKLVNYPIPLCSKKEQDQVVQEIESRLSVIDQLEQTIKDNLQKAEALRQSILKKAFGGELVL
ncbi:MAG: restriction endonuclease subunit S, partial [Bacteroidota bacterium]